MSGYRTIRAALLCATVVAVAGGLPAQAQTANPQAAANAPQQADKPDSDMQRVLDKLASLNGKPVETLSASEARKQPSPADAVHQILKDDKSTADPHAGLSVSNSHFADMGNLRLRYYTPKDVTKDSNVPVIVYFRGGGWVIADLDTYDSTPSALARKTHAIVVSVDYPMGPEHKFPAAHEEALEAYKYIAKNAKGWGGDPAKIAIVGESAGGNLAIATAIAVRDQSLPKPVALVSVYPIATTATDTPSKKDEANAKPLSTPMMAWFFDKVLPNDQAKQDTRLNLVDAKLDGLPPTTIINAQIDPLRSDGDMLADKLKAAGVDVTHKLYPGVTHEFFGMDAAVAKADEAQNFAVSQLQKGFGGNATTGADVKAK